MLAGHRKGLTQLKNYQTIIFAAVGTPNAMHGREEYGGSVALLCA
jgi:hypothetical protein